MSSNTNYPPLSWSQNGRVLTFDLINVFVDYPNLRQSIWPAVGERVVGTNKIKTCKEIAIRLLQDHDVYGEHVTTPTSLKTYAQSVETQIHTMETKWQEAKVNLGIISAGLMHKDEIWKEERGKEVHDKWEEVKKSCPYYYDLKRLLGKRLIATDHTVGNNTDLVDILEVLQEKRPQKPIDNVISDGGEEDIGYGNSKPEELEEDEEDDRKDEKNSLVDPQVNKKSKQKPLLR